MTLTVSEENDIKKISFSVGGQLTINCDAIISYEHAEQSTEITLRRPISKDYAIRFLTMVSKAFILSNRVEIKLHRKMPLTISYEFEGRSTLQFFVGPKVGEGTIPQNYDSEAESDSGADGNA